MMATVLRNCARSSATILQNAQAMCTKGKPPQILVSAVNSGEEVREHMEVFPQVIKDLTEAEEYKDIPMVNKRFARVLQYNVPTNSKSKSLLITRSYKSLVGAQNLTPEAKKLMHILAWCFDILETSMVIHDDIVDCTEIRRNSPSWYTLEDVGMEAVNDGVYLQNAPNYILKKYFAKHPMYANFIELFHEASIHVYNGQVLEYLKAVEAKANSNVFTMENHIIIRKCKAAYFPFYFPIALGMRLAENYDSSLYDLLRPCLEEMGLMIMVENDFRDVFNNISLRGENGTDIKQGRYTWMIATAHQIATPAQKEVLKQHYGRPEPESTLIIKKLYEELNLAGLYKSYIDERLGYVRGEFRRISERSPHKAFFEYLDGLVIPENWYAKEYWCT